MVARNPQVGSDRTSHATAPAQSTPAISLPKGGGALRGIDQKFSVNPSNGTASQTIPLPLSPGRSGFGPSLALSYSSGAGNGPFGLGWQLALPSVSRKTDKGLPRYLDGEESDTFILSEAEDLVPLLLPDPVESGAWIRHRRTAEEEGRAFVVERYRPRIEGSFARIERWTSRLTGETHWRSISQNNVTTLYGRTSAARIADPQDARRVFQWLVEEEFDDRGNVIAFEYKPEDRAGVDPSLLHEAGRRRDGSALANKYLKRIAYGNDTPFERASWRFQVILDYGEHDPDNPDIGEGGPWPCRADAFSFRRPAFEVRTYRLCRRVLMFHDFQKLGESPCLVRSFDLRYDESAVVTTLSEVSQRGYAKRADGGGYESKTLPPLSFAYSRVEIDETVHVMEAESLENLPTGLNSSVSLWMDLDGEGLSGVLSKDQGGWHYKRNLGSARFAPRVPVKPAPSLGDSRTGRAEFADLAGNSSIDLVLLERDSPGSFERDADVGWSPFVPFRSTPNLDWMDPRHRFVDLTGDGLPDVLFAHGDALLWNQCLGKDGFGASRMVRLADGESTGPRLIFSDSASSIYLADMTGDGLTDLVRIRNGEVCYWPNLGYGRFGAMVSMDNAPSFDNRGLFNQALVRLADIDGSGTTDIIYVGGDTVQLYFNQAGNSWSDGEGLSLHLDVDLVTDVTVIDLFGNGTACLVWSSNLPSHSGQPMRYVDLMGGQKPHLLTSVTTNMGLESRIQYAASTRFYLDDRAVGRTWACKLPFPVHVVERVEVRDQIALTKLVSTYRYHHGHFDGTEREFRGFGMVERLDTESFSRFAGVGSFTDPPAIEGEEFHLAPVLTKSWFHTGAYIDSARLTRHFESEYYAGDPEASLLPDTRLPVGLTAAEEQEAARALKGSLLHQEIYALDGSDAEDHPYTVAETAYKLKLLQPRHDQPHASFLVHQCEAITYYYERRPMDPRINHALTLEVDEFGNVRKSVMIAYGRRPANIALSDPGDRLKQAGRLIAYTEIDFTNSIDRPGEGSDTIKAAYRTPLPSGSRTYELTGYIPVGDGGHFQPEDFVLSDGRAPQLVFDEEIPYEQAPTTGRQRRLIEHQRTLYRPDDLGSGQGGPDALLPLGVIEPLALPGENYQLALTSGLAEQVYVDSEKMSADELEDVLLHEGGYRRFDDDAGWWIPSGRIFYHPESDLDPLQELAEARQHFFLPRRVRSPFGTNATFDYDLHNLAAVRTTDPLNNVVEAEIDYRTLQPFRMTDPNGNRSQVALDARGLVVGTAVQGKVSETLGDSLAGFDADPSVETIRRHVDDPLGLGPEAESPHASIAGATSRLIYDLDRFRDLGQPPVVYSIGRETHASDATPGQQARLRHSLTYSDGSGREIMTKVVAEAGPVDLDDPDASIANPRWIGTGRTIYDNKGNTIKQYEPYFSENHRFETEPELVNRGVTPILRRDPLGRAIRTDFPDGSFARVEFGPWHTATWDQNDTVLASRWFRDRQALPVGDPDRRAVDLTVAHADTPSVAHLDPLGRIFLTVADNGPEGGFETRVTSDIEGNTLVAADGRQRDVEANIFDLTGTIIRTASMDRGERWSLLNVAGNPIYGWDSRGHRIRGRYDELQRRTHSLLKTEDGDEIVVARSIYGESHPEAQRLNLRGQVFLELDQSGLAISAGLDPETGNTEAFDFKGNPLRSRRRLARDFREMIDWSVVAAVADPTAIEAAANSILEVESFGASTRYDALNRLMRVIAPDASEVRPEFNEAGLLERLEVRIRGADEVTTFVESIDYDEKGRRISIRYGNGVTTDHDYDPLTFRLRRIVSRRSGDGEVLQDVRYFHDPVGNITEISDLAQPTIFTSNQTVEPRHLFVYDAIYRLIEASGREHPGQIGGQVDHRDPPIPPAHPNDGRALRNYVERYRYDEVGNILSMVHQAGSGSWTRHHAYDPDSNRLFSTSMPGDAPPPGPFSATYQHDVHGNMIRMPHLAQVEWDYADQMRRVDLGGGGVAFYVYDATGKRVRKVVERNGSVSEERVYLGAFERFRRRNASGVQVERETLHIVDDTRRVALVETLTAEGGAAIVGPMPRLRYQIANHLGSAVVEVDGGAQIISYEEYFPFGATSYRAGPNDTEVRAKRYRYIGKERDEETGLSYHGARYYAPWLGRWTAADPIGLKGGINSFAYCGNSPLSLADKNGLAPGDPDDLETVPDESGGSTDYGTGMTEEDQEQLDAQTPSRPPRAAASEGLTDLDLYRYAVARYFKPDEYAIDEQNFYRDERLKEADEQVKHFFTHSPVPFPNEDDPRVQKLINGLYQTQLDALFGLEADISKEQAVENFKNTHAFYKNFSFVNVALLVVSGAAAVRGTAARLASRLGARLGSLSKTSRLVNSPQFQPRPRPSNPSNVNGTVGEAIVNDMNKYPTLPESRLPRIPSATGTKTFRRLDAPISYGADKQPIFTQVKQKGRLTRDDIEQLVDTLRHAASQNGRVELYLRPGTPLNWNARDATIRQYLAEVQSARDSGLLDVYTVFYF